MKKLPENFEEFYREINALLDNFKLKLYNEINERIKKVETQPKDPIPPIPTSALDKENMFDLKYSTTGAINWSDGERAEFEKAAINLMIKYRLVILSANLSIKKLL